MFWGKREFRIIILDDDSQNFDEIRSMVKTFTRLDIQIHKFCRQKSKKNNLFYRGYFYENQQIAFEMAKEQSIEQFLFLEDDVQLVWDGQNFYNRARDFFSAHENVFHINFQFPMMLNKRKIEQSLHYDFKNKIFINNNWSRTTMGMYSVKNLPADFRFDLGNEKSISQYFFERGYISLQSGEPFFVQVPEPTVWKYSEIDRANTEWDGNPPALSCLTDAVQRKLIQLNTGKIPYAEYWIQTKNWSARIPFRFSGETAYQKSLRHYKGL